jgi:hypothetical protein
VRQTGAVPPTEELPALNPHELRAAKPALVPNDTAVIPLAPLEPPKPVRQPTPRPQPAPAASEDSVEIDEAAVPQYGFAGVYRGLAFHYFKTAANILAVILFSILLAIVLYLQTRPPDWVVGIAVIATLILLIALVVLLFVSPLLGLLGSILCLSVPSGTRGARGFIMVSVLLDVLPIAGLGVGYLLDAQGVLDWPPTDPRTGFGPATRLAQVFGTLSGLGAVSFFLVFLSCLSRYFRDRVLADEAFALIGRVWAVAAGWVVVGALFACLAYLDANRQQYDQSLIIGLGLFVLITVPLALWASIWMLRGILDLIGSVRHVILSRTT